MTFQANPAISTAPLSEGTEIARRHGAEPFGSAAEEDTVPKMKTNRAAAKRFRISGSGRVRRSKAGGNHGMQEKSRKRLRRLRNNDMVAGSFEKRIKIMLPYG